MKRLTIANVAGKALPLVSMIIRSGETSFRRVSSASPSWPTRLQQIQPLSSSCTPEMADDEANWESIARSPNSFLSKASLYPFGN